MAPGPRALALAAALALLAGPALAHGPDLGVGALLCDAQVDQLSAPTATIGAGCVRPRWSSAERTLKPADRGQATGHLAVSPDGTRLFVASTALSDLGAHQVMVTAYATGSGARLWGVRHQGPAGSPQDKANGVAVSPDGATVFVTGRSSGLTDDDASTLALRASDGALRWEARFDRGVDTSAGVAVSHDGSAVYIAGTSSEDLFLASYDPASGEERWRTLYGTPATEAASDMALAPGGGTLLVVGRTSPQGHGDYLTVAVEPATGVLRWASQLVETRPFDEAATEVVVSADGRLAYVTGTTGNDYLTAAYDVATGVPVWFQREGTGDAAAAHPPHLAVAAGRVILAGRHFAMGSNAFLTAAYDGATGAPLWSARFYGSLRTSEATALAASDATGRAYVSGSSLGLPGNDEIATVAYDLESGVLAWSGRLDRRAGSDASPSAVAVAPDGSHVFVTGTASEDAPPGSGTPSWLNALTVAHAP